MKTNQNRTVPRANVPWLIGDTRSVIRHRKLPVLLLPLLAGSPILHAQTAAWTEITHPTSPAFAHHDMTYDSARQRLIVAGRTFTIRHRTSPLLAALVAQAAGLGTAVPPGTCELALRLVPALTLRCPAGSTNEIQYTSSLPRGDDWMTLTNLVLPYSPYEFVDLSGGTETERYYRVLTLGQGPAPDTNRPPRARIYFNLFSHQEAVGSLANGFRAATNFATWLTNDLDLLDTNGLVSDQYFGDFIAALEFGHISRDSPRPLG